MASMVGNTGGTSAEVNRGPQVTGQRAQPSSGGKPGLIGGAKRAAQEAIRSESQRERGALQQTKQQERLGGVRQMAVAKAASLKSEGRRFGSFPGRKVGGSRLMGEGNR